MSLPPLFSMFLQYSYNFIDSAFVAQIGEDALTAVSLSFPLTTFMIACSIGIGVGVNVLIAHYLGAGKQDEANTLVTLGLIVSFIIGVILNVLIWLVLPIFFQLYTDNPTIYRYAMDYMMICVFIQVPNMMHIAIQKILQGTGNMLTPMYCQALGVVFNIVFDPILIFGIGFFPAFGVKGAAISSVLGYTVSMVVIAYFLFFRKQRVQVKTKGFRFNPRMFSAIFRFGLPSFFLNVLGAAMTSLSNIILVPISMTAVAFFSGAYFKIQHIVVMTVNGLIQGCLPIMSFNYGAKLWKRLEDTVRYATLFSFPLMATGTLLLLFFPRQILMLFHPSEEFLRIGIPAMRIMSLGFGFNGLSMMLSTYLQAIGHVRKSIWINLLRQLILVIPLMWILAKFFGQTGVWIALPITEVIVFGLALYYYRKYRIGAKV